MKLIIKIPLFMGIIVLVGFTAMSIAVGFKIRGIIEQSSMDALSSEVYVSAEFLESKIDGQLSVLEEIAARARVRIMDWNVVQPSLKPDIPRLGVIDFAMATPEGVSYSVLENNTSHVKDKAYFQRALA